MPFAIFAIAALLSTAAAHPTTSDEARVVGALTEQQPNAVKSQSNVAAPTTSDEARVLRPLREQQPNAVKSRSNVVHATTSDEARVLGALGEQPNAVNSAARHDKRNSTSTGDAAAKRGSPAVPETKHSSAAQCC